METTKPVRSNQPEAAATSPQPKKFVKVKSGATLVSTTYFNPASNPEASPQPTIAEITPSRRKGSWIDQDEAPTNFITPVSRRRLKAAIRSVLLISRAAVNTKVIRQQVLHCEELPEVGRTSPELSVDLAQYLHLVDR